MARQNERVPFGYEPPKERSKERGTLWVYDSFESWTEGEVAQVLAAADNKRLEKVVFYPLHEDTLRRMGEQAVPYYQRVDALEDMLERARTHVYWVIDKFEGKRKKYTPMDTAFRFLEEKYKSPYFVYTSAEMAHKLAGYDKFELWVKKVRWLIAGDLVDPLHPKLQANATRWEHVQPDL